MCLVKVSLITVFFVFVQTLALCDDNSGFTREDRERLIRLETTLQMYMQITDKRFEDMNKRLEEMSKRIDETRQDMNKRNDDLRMDMNSRFDQLIIYISILAGIFTALVMFLIAYLFWDRRTFLKKARDEAIEKIEKDYKLREILQVLTEYAKDDPKFETLLKKYNIL